MFAFHALASTSTLRRTFTRIYVLIVTIHQHMRILIVPQYSRGKLAKLWEQVLFKLYSINVIMPHSKIRSKLYLTNDTLNRNFSKTTNRSRARLEIKCLQSFHRLIWTKKKKKLHSVILMIIKTNSHLNYASCAKMKNQSTCKVKTTCWLPWSLERRRARMHSTT